LLKDFWGWLDEQLPDRTVIGLPSDPRTVVMQTLSQPGLEYLDDPDCTEHSTRI